MAWKRPKIPKNTPNLGKKPTFIPANETGMFLKMWGSMTRSKGNCLLKITLFKGGTRRGRR